MGNEHARSETDQGKAGRVQQVIDILDRGVVVKTLPTRREVVDRLASTNPARIYIGADPTGPSLHLSHAKNYLLLEEFRQLGHQVIVLFGDFTARIGDPTDRDSARHGLSDDEIRTNVGSWLEQVRPVISFDDPVNPAQIKYNSQWLAGLSLSDVIDLLGMVTVQRMLERDMFQRRLVGEQPIHLHEFLYPMLQGYDTVAMDVDIELCGTDQEFNALMGRTLRRRMSGKDKLVIEVNLMENPRTGQLMSKSSGVGVFLDTTPEDLYGQVMALPDEMTRVCFVNNTRIPLAEIDRIVAGHPRDAKATLARHLVELLRGPEAAAIAEHDFEQRFVSKAMPDSAPRVPAPWPRASALEVAELGGAKEVYGSRAAVRRVIRQGGLKIDGVSISDPRASIAAHTVLDVRVGKRIWFMLAPHDAAIE